MKKKILIGLLAFSTLTLSACGSTPNVDNNGDGSGEVQKPVDNDTPVTKEIKKLRKGVALHGTYVQTREFYTDENFNEIDTTTSQGDKRAQANITFGFTPDAFYRKVSTVVEGEEALYTEDTYIKDEYGYAYKEYLSYENKVEKNYQMSYDNKCSFVNMGYGNPFNNIFESDLTYNESDKTYSLDLGKASDIFTTLLSFYAAGIVNTGASCTISTNAKGEFTKLTYVLTPRKVAEYNSMANTTTYYITDQTIDVIIEDLDEETSVVERIEPIKPNDNAQMSQLKTALESFNPETLQIEVRDKQVGGTETYKNMWYNGSSVYVKHYSPSTGGSLNSLDKDYDYILAPNEKASTLYEARGYDETLTKWIPSNSTKFGKTSQDKYSYKDLVFDFSKISTDLFVYDKTKNAFVCNNIGASDVANKGLQPKARELANSNLAYTDEVVIAVKNGKIDRVTAHYSYYNFYTNTQVEGEVRFQIKKTANVSLPFGAVVENVGGTR